MFGGAPLVALACAATSGGEVGDPTHRLVDDLVVGYALMHITAARVGGRDVEPTFNRHNLMLQFGVGDFSIGAVLQRATPSPTTEAGTADTGVMLTVGYDRPLTTWLTVDAFARVGVSSGHNDGQPLYATDTDLRLKFVFSDPDGWGPVDRPWFPSFYVGTIVNRYRRVQAIGGIGLWFSGIGAYATGLYAFNGVVDPMMPGDDTTSGFAAAKNASVTASLSYDWSITSQSVLHFELRKNIPIRNAGNEVVGIIEARHFFE